MSATRGTPPEPGTAGSPSPAELRRAGLWSRAFQALLDRVAHDVNNALNGALVNLEVVKARARPGVDGATIASFAEAASSEVESTARLAAAILTLGRPARGAPDVARIAADVVTLLAPGLSQSAVRLETAGVRSAVVAAHATDVRLAVVSALLAVVELVRRRGETVEIAGALPASDTGGVVRCTTTSEPRPTFVIAPCFGATLAPDVRGALAEAGIGLDASDDALALAFPGVSEP